MILLFDNPLQSPHRATPARQPGAHTMQGVPITAIDVLAAVALGIALGLLTAAFI